LKQLRQFDALLLQFPQNLTSQVLQERSDVKYPSPIAHLPQLVKEGSSGPF